MSENVNDAAAPEAPEHQSAQVIGALVSGDAVSRLTAAGDLLFQTESYIRAIRQAMRGLSCQLLDNAELHRDCWSIERISDEVLLWLKAHQAAIYGEAEKMKETEQGPAAAGLH